MVDLIHMLQDYDLSLLHMIAQSWGFELSAPDARTAVPMLASFILDAELVEEVDSRDIPRLPYKKHDGQLLEQFTCRS